MRRIETNDNDLCNYREPAYACWIVAVPFYMAAVVFLPLWYFLALDGFRASFWQSGWGVLVLLAGGAYGLYLTISTAWDWFGRRGCLVDRRQNTLTAQAGLFFPGMTSRTVRLDEFHQLVVHGWREVGSRTGRTFRTEYYLDLLGPGQDYVRLGRSAAKADVLAMGEAIADFTDLDLFDDTYQPSRVLRRGHVSLKLRTDAMHLLNLARELVRK